MCLPSGARVGSATLCWPSSRNGWSAGPSWACSTECRNSSSVPPTWTVPAPRDLRVRPRDRAVERPVDLHRRRADAVAAQQRVGTSRAGRPSARARCGIRSAITIGAAVLLVGDPTPVTRPSLLSTSRHARAGADLAAERRAGRRRARRSGAPRRPSGSASRRRARAGSGRRRRSRSPRRPAACRRAARRRRATRARPVARTAACRARRRWPGSMRANSASRSGPAPASSFSGPPTGGKPVSIVARTASQCSRNGSANSAQRAADALPRPCGRGRGRGTSRRRRAAGARRRPPGAPTRARARAAASGPNTGDATAAG